MEPPVYVPALHAFLVVFPVQSFFEATGVAVSLVLLYVGGKIVQLSPGQIYPQPQSIFVLPSDQ